MTSSPLTDLIVVPMMEVRAEATCVRHHKKKIACLFAALRHLRPRTGW